MKTILGLLLLIILNSCATNKFMAEEKKLRTQDYIYYKIIWCDYYYIYLENHPEGKVKNRDHIMGYVGDELLLPIQFKERP